MNDKQLILYARLVLLRALNLKEDEDLIINAPIEAQDFVRALTQEAYKTFKSGYVHVNYHDPVLTRIKYKYAKEDVLDDLPEYIIARMKEETDRNAAFLTISSSFPGLLHEVDQKRIMRAQKASASKTRPYQQKILQSLKFSNVVYPALPWAKAVYPKLEDSDALMRLHGDIINLFNLDGENPLKTYTEHMNALEQRRKTLNEYRFESLSLQSASMDLTMRLPEQHIWLSGAQKRRGDIFVPQLPMGEIYTAPLKSSVNGTFETTKPLHFRGKNLKPFKMTLKYGEVIEVRSENEKILQQVINADPGAKFLGEIGLVPKENLLYQNETLYYQAMLDEQRCTHVALGNAYPMSVKHQEKNANDIAKKHGINQSRLHVDLPVGSDDLTIIGTTPKGEEITIFEAGTWASRFQ